MSLQTPGLHHVTAIAGDPQRNLDFYAGVLGLRCVKLTVTFDDPSTYHLFYGDEMGLPGSLLTCLPFEHALPGRPGADQARTPALLVPPASLDLWRERLAAQDRTVAERERFDEVALAFEDPEGLPLELVGHADARGLEPWADGPVPAEHAVRGCFGVTLALADPAPAAELLAFLGFEEWGTAGGRRRFRASGRRGAVVDLVADDTPGVQGTGTVHHVAFRVPDEATQQDWRVALQARGYRVSDVKDRRYFSSVYIRGPGGVLFELATDGPGVTLDEDAEALGAALQLPPWLEDHREDIEARLVGLESPGRSADVVNR